MLPGDTAAEGNPDSCEEPCQVEKWGRVWETAKAGEVDHLCPIQLE